MIANHIHDALNQVRRMQELIHEKRHFHGYSGLARLISGTAACMAAIILSSDKVPPDPTIHLLAWGAVLTVSLVANYGSLAFWFCTDHEVRRNPIMLKPALDAIPALAAGAVVSLALILQGHYNLLMGCWMLFYGLSQVAYRLSLPQGIYWGGVWYLAWGATCLLLPNLNFTTPWPMGVAFLIGESYGGYTLFKLKKESSL
jgi:hypothetical protein